MIFIITQRDPFFIDTFLREFDKNGVEYKLCNLPNFNKGFGNGIKKAFKLYHFRGLIMLLFEYMNIMIRNKKLKNIVSSTNYKSIEDASSFLSEIKSGDILLSLSAPCRIPVEKLPSNVTSINIHCGKLPKYAGMMPIFWQIYDGCDQITITIQKKKKKIDTGRIIYEQPMDVRNSFYETSVKAKKESAKAFMHLLSTDFNLVKKYSSNSSNINLKLTKFPASHEIKSLSQKIKLI